MFKRRIQYPVYKSPGFPGRIFFGNFNRFVDGNLGRNILEVQKLADRQAQDQPVDNGQPLDLPVANVILYDTVQFIFIPCGF